MATKQTTKKTTKPAAAAAQVAPAAQAPAPTVALRGGAAVALVRLGGKPYRTAAKHNMDWWAQVTQAAATKPAPVADLIKAGVPSHFIGYALRRGYLQAA